MYLSLCLYVCLYVCVAVHFSKLPNFAFGRIFKLIHLNDGVDSSESSDNDDNDDDVCTF